MRVTAIVLGVVWATSLSAQVDHGVNMQACVAPELIQIIKTTTDSKVAMADLKLLEEHTEQIATGGTDVGLSIKAYTGSFDQQYASHDIRSFLQRSDYQLNTDQSLQY